MSPTLIAIASIGVTLLLAGIGYLIKGMLATGQLTEKVSDLATKAEKTAQSVEEIRSQMLKPADLENAVLKLKLEVMRESFVRDSDKKIP